MLVAPTPFPKPPSAVLVLAPDTRAGFVSVPALARSKAADGNPSFSTPPFDLPTSVPGRWPPLRHGEDAASLERGGGLQWSQERLMVAAMHAALPLPDARASHFLPAVALVQEVPIRQRVHVHSRTIEDCASCL